MMAWNWNEGAKGVGAPGFHGRGKVGGFVASYPPIPRGLLWSSEEDGPYYWLDGPTVRLHNRARRWWSPGLPADPRVPPSSDTNKHAREYEWPTLMAHLSAPVLAGLAGGEMLMGQNGCREPS
jgi:hypothetical protein